MRGRTDNHACKKAASHHRELLAATLVKWLSLEATRAARPAPAAAARTQ